MAVNSIRVRHHPATFNSFMMRAEVEEFQNYEKLQNLWAAKITVKTVTSSFFYIVITKIVVRGSKNWLETLFLTYIV